MMVWAWPELVLAQPLPLWQRLLKKKNLKAREMEAKADGMNQDLLCCWKPQQERQELGTLKSVTQV